MHSTRIRTLAAVALAGAVAIAALLAATRGEASTQTAPANTAPPAVSGTTSVGSTLTTTNGTWSGTTPITFTYAWQRCNATGGSCSAISGATTSTYTLQQVDAGTTLRAQVTATNADGNASSTSVPTAVVQSTPAPPATGCPTTKDTGPISVNEVSPPARLLVDQQAITPRPVTRDTQRIVIRFHVTACSGRPITGALVYATPTPYQQFADVETPTGPDGWATLNMQRLNSFPASGKQQLLAVFVRARKPGEDLLGGISTRRLVSFPVNLG